MKQSSQITQALAEAGLENCELTGTGAGLYNDSYYVDCSQGRYLIRIAPSDDFPKLFYEIEMMRSEPEIHRLVREHTNIPVPKIIDYDFSRNILDRDYLIMEFLPGRPGRFDQSRLGEYVRQLHSIKSQTYGYPDRKAPTGENWPDTFRTYIELIFRDSLSCGAIDQGEYDDFLSIYERNFDAVEQTDACLLHLDLWSQNILTQNGRITAILDFDRGLYGDPELEFAVLDTYGYSTPEFFRGYGRPRPASPKAQIRQKLYIVYEIIKYAFSKTARRGSPSGGRRVVEQCRSILSDL